jgi:hypothetical protein
MTNFGEDFASARQRILDELLSMQWRGWRYLERIGGIRYGARILELKRLGYKLEAAPTNDPHGKMYRLLSPDPGEPQLKQVKIYLPEEYVIELLTEGKLRPEAEAIVAKALRIFQANKHKL